MSVRHTLHIRLGASLAPPPSLPLPPSFPASSSPSLPSLHATYSGSTLGQALSEVLVCHLSLTYSYKTGIAPSFSQMRELRCGRLRDLLMAPDLTSKTVLFAPKPSDITPNTPEVYNACVWCVLTIFGSRSSSRVEGGQQEQNAGDCGVHESGGT